MAEIPEKLRLKDGKLRIELPELSIQTLVIPLR